MAPKNTRLTFRVRSQLKEKLERVAASESRSVAQICEAFLQAGLLAYEKEGSKYVSRYLASHETVKEK
jgi:predicted transcriptional regulator